MVEEEPVVVVVEEKEEPAPVVVAAPVPVKPAPVDSDKDGVFDEFDKCPGTDPAFIVDEDGCPKMLSQTVEIKMDVKFPNNSSILSKDNYAEISKVANFLKQFDGTKVTVEGHTDSNGSNEYNKMLSQRRADSVKNSLIKDFNIAAERVSAVGYGEEKPVADNSTAEGRAENRRVVGVVEAIVKKAATK